MVKDFFIRPPPELLPVLGKYEGILLWARHILVMRIRIFKYDVFWLGVFGVH